MKESVDLHKNQEDLSDATISIIGPEIQTGGDIVGVFLVGDQHSQWCGVNVSIADARKISPQANATSWLVVLALIVALEFIQDNANVGIHLPEDLPLAKILPIIERYVKITSVPADE